VPASVGRMELWSRLGRITVAEAMLDSAAAYRAEHEWRHSQHDSPHGQSWFTSMHVSRFPGADPRACDRALAYEMMAFADAEPMPQKVPAAGIIGVAIEDWEVSLLDFDGRLLSTKADAEHQVGFEDADHWLTGSPDIIVLPPFWNRPLVIEAKGEKLERVEDMRALKRSYWPKHARQCRGYVGMGQRISPLLWPFAIVCRHTWRLAEPGAEPVIDAMVCRDHGIHADSGCLITIDLQPIKDGVLLYSARDNPEIRASFYFEHDEAWFQKGLAVLERAQGHYAHDRIPPHPFGGKQWSAKPCQYCGYKKNVCKPDHQAGTSALTESHGVAWSREVYGEHAYDPMRIRQQVLDRWRGRSGYSFTLPAGHTNGAGAAQKEREHV
jgi:hypothetical protein